MFLKKNNENIVFFLSYVAIAFSYLYLRNSLFSHWSDILDQDVTIIYNALLLGSNIQQEYLDHPAYTTIFFLNIFFKLGYFFQLIEVKNINTLLLSENKDLALQHIHNFSQTIHILYSIILVLILRNLLERILNDKISSFILSIIFMLSPSFIFLLEIIRSEILSLIFIFLFYICLDNYINKSIIYVFYSGIFFTLALLSKVQVIICFIPLLIIVFLLNYKKLLIREKINISNVANIILTFFLLIFTIYIVDNFFYKRIDKIVFIIIFFILLFFLSYFDKKKFNQNNINLSLFLFFIGCSSIIVLLKFLSFLGISPFHIALLDIITSPISQMSSISTGYQTANLDNFDFIFKVIKFFIEVLTFTDGVYTGIKFHFLLNKFNIFIYFFSLFFILFFFIKKNYYNLITILVINILIISIIFVFNLRPYFFYDIYILPFNIILISIIIKNFKYKKAFSIIMLIIYLSLNVLDIKNTLNQKRNSGIFNKKVNVGNNMNNICKNSEIENKSSYMRYWHRRYNAKFLKELCSDYFN